MPPPLGVSGPGDATHATRSPARRGGGMPTTPPPPSHLPPTQAALITLCQFTEAVHTTLPYTLAVYLVRDLLAGASEGAVGAATGGVAAVWCAAQFATSVWWGRVSDTHGRKPLVLISAAASGVSVLWFATSKSLTGAALARLAGGALNSTFVSLKCMLGELVPTGPAQAKGMSLLALGWGLGTLVGPATGGLSHPCSAPRLAALLPAAACTETTGLFVTSPFLLPALVAAFVSVFTFTLSALFLRETLPAKRRGRAVLKAKSSARWEADDDDPGDVEMAAVAEGAPLLVTARAGGPPPPPPADDKPPPPPLSASPWYAHRPALWALAGYGLTAFLFNLSDELLPLWASAATDVGGLALSPASLAIPLAVGGAALIAWCQLGYIHVQHAIGTRRTAATALIAGAPLVALLPLPSLLPSTWAGPALCAMLALRAVAGNNAFTSSMILVNSNAPPGCLGPVNGAGQTLASAARALGPALGGGLWALASVTPLIGRWLPFALVAAGMAVSARVFDRVSPPPGEGEPVLVATEDEPLAPLSPER